LTLLLFSSMRISSLACFVVVRLLMTAVALAGLVQAASSVYDFYLVSLEGKSVPLKQYDGKVLLIVNLATKTEYKGQIPKLEALYEKYEPQGLVVIGIPSNDFGAGQPEKPAEIQQAYAEYKLKFPLFGKSSVTGKDQIPLYAFITGTKKPGDIKAEVKDEGEKKDASPTAGEVPWNFTKYLTDRKGKPIARFDADVAPDAPELIVAIEEALNAKPGAGDKETEKAGREVVRAR
jgi:glutathione peroxidase